MAKNPGLTTADLPTASLDRRKVINGVIGVAGRVPRAAKDLAARIGLPHKESWTLSLPHRGKDGSPVVTLADMDERGLVPTLRTEPFLKGGVAVRPIRNDIEISMLSAELASAGLPPEKYYDLKEFLIKQARSPSGVVISSKVVGMSRASALMSFFREAEVDADLNVGYHVHVEEMIDLSFGGREGDALRTCFAAQVEADLACLAHRLKENVRFASVDIFCESNNEDTHRAAEDLSEIIETTVERLAAKENFTAAIDGAVEFASTQSACFTP